MDYESNHQESRQRPGSGRQRSADGKALAKVMDANPKCYKDG